MTNQIDKLTQSISEIETEIKSLQEEKSQLSMQPPATEAQGITPSEIARAARQSSLDDQKRRSELESVSAAIAALTEHLKRRQSELAQAQREQLREGLTSEVEALRSGVGQAVEAANELSSQLQAQLIELKTLANQAQPAYSQWQREFSNVGSKPENLLEVEFARVPVVVARGKGFTVRGEKINLLWAEQAAKADREAQHRAWRAGSQERFERGARRREAENLAKHQAALEAQRTAKEIELEDFKQKLIEVKQGGGYSTQPVEGAIAGTHQQILDLSKEIHELKTKITDLEAQNDTAA